MVKGSLRRSTRARAAFGRPGRTRRRDASSARILETIDIDYKKGGIGVAIDVGTTTIAGACLELSTGRITASASVANPQARWGRDVVSRLDVLQRDPGLLAEMSASLASACEEIIRSVAVDLSVTELTAAGNPVMEHLLLGVSPAPLARPPFRPAFKEARRLKAGQAGISSCAEAQLYAFPLVGGFVGGDAVAVALHLGLRGMKEPVLAVDIGTNSEIMLASGGALWATSAAAGPAFEGGEISSGMVASAGAIEGVAVKGDYVNLDVIGGISPKGLCGSGLIGAASALIKAGVIERTGRIKDRDEVEDNLSNRVERRDGGNAFVLHRGPSGAVALTQQDIRALQTAKAATRAGIEVLLKKAGLKTGDVGRVYVAGAFGSHLGPADLCAIGLLDPSWAGTVSFAGDAALKGALLALSDEKKAEAEALAAEFKYVPLSGSAHFEEEFIRRMDF